MKVLYDSENNACAVEFDEDDTVFMGVEEGKLVIYSCRGGKPEVVERQLMVGIITDKEGINNEGA